MNKSFKGLSLFGLAFVLTDIIPGTIGAEPNGLARERFREPCLLLSQVKSKDSKGYDPTKDPGSASQGRSVDYEKLKGLMEKFDSGLGQKGKSQKSAEPPAPVPIPKEYTTPGEPSDSKEIPRVMEGQPSIKPQSSDLSSSPLLPEKEKAILQKYSK